MNQPRPESQEVLDILKIVLRTVILNSMDFPFQCELQTLKRLPLENMNKVNLADIAQPKAEESDCRSLRTTFKKDMWLASLGGSDLTGEWLCAVPRCH